MSTSYHTSIAIGYWARHPALAGKRSYHYQALAWLQSVCVCITRSPFDSTVRGKVAHSRLTAMMPALDAKKSREISLLWSNLGAIKVHGYDTRGTDYEFVRPTEATLDAPALALIELARTCDYLSLSTEVTESDRDSRKPRTKNHHVTERPGVLAESSFDGDAPREAVKNRIIPMRNRLTNDLGRTPTQRELAQALGVSQPTVSQVLSRLSVVSKRGSPIRRPVVRVVETGQVISGEVTNVETAAETLKHSDRQLMTVSELAAMLRCSKRSIFRRVSDGKIPASVTRRFGRRVVLFDRIAIKEWVASL